MRVAARAQQGCPGSQVTVTWWGMTMEPDLGSSQQSPLGQKFLVSPFL